MARVAPAQSGRIFSLPTRGMVTRNLSLEEVDHKRGDLRSFVFEGEVSSIEQMKLGVRKIAQVRQGPCEGNIASFLPQTVAGTRAITPDTGLRLSRFFGVNDGFWIGLQSDYDTAIERNRIALELKKIKPWKAAA
jgi:hypothetical protein